MKQKTATTFGELALGDRFYFVSDKQRTAYQVTKERLLGKQFYNHFDGNGEKMWLFDKQADSDRPVIFLRHTRPSFSEECALSDLRDGDVFHLPNDIIKEYQVIKNRHGLITTPLIGEVDEDNKNTCFSSFTRVVFVRKLEEVKL